MDSYACNPHHRWRTQAAWTKTIVAKYAQPICCTWNFKFCLQVHIASFIYLQVPQIGYVYLQAKFESASTHSLFFVLASTKKRLCVLGKEYGQLHPFSHTYIFKLIFKNYCYMKTNYNVFETAISDKYNCNSRNIFFCPAPRISSIKKKKTI